MNIYEIIKFMKPNWHKYETNNDTEILTKNFNLEFPNDYLIFLQEMGEGSYQFNETLFSLWDTNSVIQYNKEYKIDSYLGNDLIGIGTDAGGICFLLDYRNTEKMNFSSIGLGDLDIEEINILADSFTSALNLMIKGEITLDNII